MDDNKTQINPSIEVEKQLSKVEGLMRHLRTHLPEIWMREQADQVLEAANEARGQFREHLNFTRHERMRLIEMVSCASR